MMKRILLIEDNPDVRENTAEILELSNYEVEVAENGKKGLQLALKNPPDLILCDVMMPELDGFGVLRILNNNPHTIHVPFIFLTAKAEKEDMRRGMRMGADDYLTKPFDDIELLDVVALRLKKSVNAHRQSSSRLTEDELLGMLLKDRELRRYSKKESIFEEDVYPRYLFYLKSGKVKLSMMNEDGKMFITTIYKEHDFFGHLALLRNAPYTETAAAIEDCEVYLIPKDDFFEILYSHSEVSAYFMQLLSTSIKMKEEQLLRLAYDSVRKRVADALLLIGHRFEKPQEPFRILRDDLANIVGTAKETVIRTLADFKQEGLIDIKSGKICILDPDALLEMPN